MSETKLVRKIRGGGFILAHPVYRQGEQYERKTQNTFKANLMQYVHNSGEDHTRNVQGKTTIARYEKSESSTEHSGSTQNAIALLACT